MSILQQALLEYGLYASHSLALSEDEKQHLELNEHETGLLLVGNRGSSYWPVFSGSPEFADGQADPLDRWSERIAGLICGEHAGLRAVFPSDGPPYLPFQRWAMTAEALSPSPLGLLIHPVYGLWHSIRFALLFDWDDDPVGPAADAVAASPCDSCADRPCLQRCPINAFTEQGYDFLACASYLKNNEAAECHQLGCLARYACPVGDDYRYDSAQHRFHLQAFLSSH